MSLLSLLKDLPSDFLAPNSTENSSLAELSIIGLEEIDKNNRIVIVMQQYKNTYTVWKHKVLIILNEFCSV